MLRLLVSIAWFVYFGIPNLPFGLILGTLLGLAVTVRIMLAKEDRWMRKSILRVALLSLPTFVLGYLAWPFVFMVEIRFLLQEQGRIKDLANLAVVALMLLGFSLASIPAALRSRFS